MTPDLSQMMGAPPPRQHLAGAASRLEANLLLLQELVEELEQAGAVEQKDRRLLFAATGLCEFYLLVEDSLLCLATQVDGWGPASLDWRSRLLQHLASSVSGHRPALISEGSRELIEACLHHYRGFAFNKRASSPSRLESLVEKAITRWPLLQQEFRASPLLPPAKRGKS